MSDIKTYSDRVRDIKKPGDVRKEIDRAKKYAEKLALDAKNAGTLEEKIKLQRKHKDAQAVCRQLEDKRAELEAMVIRKVSRVCLETPSIEVARFQWRVIVLEKPSGQRHFMYQFQIEGIWADQTDWPLYDDLKGPPEETAKLWDLYEHVIQHALDHGESILDYLLLKKAGMTSFPTSKAFDF